jgi:hypothetical protein
MGVITATTEPPDPKQTPSRPSQKRACFSFYTPAPDRYLRGGSSLRPGRAPAASHKK